MNAEGILHAIDEVERKLRSNNQIRLLLALSVLLSYAALVTVLLWPLSKLFGILCGILVGGLFYLWFKRLSLSDEASSARASRYLDDVFGAKERVLSALLLSETEDVRGEVVVRQLQSIVSEELTPDILPSLDIPRSLRNLAFSAPLVLLLIGLTLFLRLSKSPVSDEALLVSELLKDNPALPEPLKDALQDLKSELTDHEVTSEEVSAALERAESELQRSKIELEKSGGTEAKTIENTSREPNQAGASETPTPTPTPPPSNKQSQEGSDKQENQNQADNQSKDSKDEKSKEGDKGEKESGGKKDNSESKESKEKSGQGNGQSEKSEGKGEGKKESQTGEGKGSSEKQDQKEGKEGSKEGQGGEGKEGGQDKTKGESQGEKGSQNESQEGSKESNESQSVKEAEQALNKIRNEAEKKNSGDQKQSQGEKKADGNKKEEGKEGKQGSSGKDQNQKGKEKGDSEEKGSKGSGSQPGSEKQEEKKKDEGSSDQAGGQKAGEEKEGESQSSKKDSSSKDSESKDPASESSLGQPGEAKEFVPKDEGDGKSPYGDKKTLKDTEVENQDEKFDTRYTGKEGEIAKNKGEARPKTSLSDVILAKPDPVKDSSSQPIPLEYRDVLE